MTPQLERRIRDMAGENTSEEKILEVLAGWERLFNSFQIPPHQQEKEFMDTMRVRTRLGIVSIVADRV